MIYIHRVKAQTLHCCSYSLNIYNTNDPYLYGYNENAKEHVERIQNGIEDQIESKLNVFKSDLIIINYN
jgi:hypothetical protein